MDERAIVAVLAGGRGERLGGGKPSAELAGIPLISHPLRAAREAGLETVVVAKESTPLPPLEEPVLFDAELPSHPLSGLACALEHAATRTPAAGVVFLACDMPFVTPSLVRFLAGLDGAAVAELDGRLHPAICRCEPRHLPALRAALAAERPLGEAITALAPQIIGEHELRRFGQPHALLFNVNSPAELAHAGRRLTPRSRPPRDSGPPHGAPRARARSARRSSR